MIEKTGEPTPRRLARARAEGDGPASATASRAVGFAAATLLLPALGAGSATAFTDGVRRALAAPSASSALLAAGGDLVHLAVPIAAIVAMSTAVAQGAQSGFMLVVPSARTRPRAALGLPRPWSLARAAAGLALALAIVLAGGRAALIAVARTASPASSAASVAATLTTAGALAGFWSRRAAIAAVALAALDLVRARWEFSGRVRMTRDEVEAERRESKPNDEVAAVRRDALAEVAAEAPLAEIAGARVVVTDRAEREAVALRYAHGSSEPPRVAVGGRVRGPRIVARARELRVPVIANDDLVARLRGVPDGAAIPEPTFEAVADLLARVPKARG